MTKTVTKFTFKPVPRYMQTDNESVLPWIKLFASVTLVDELYFESYSVITLLQIKLLLTYATFKNISLNIAMTSVQQYFGN